MKDDGLTDSATAFMPEPFELENRFLLPNRAKFRRDFYGVMFHRLAIGHGLIPCPRK
jgi:hypothetical protein